MAYWFQHDLRRITERLYKLKITFAKLDSSESIRRWNAGEIPVALIHPASAGQAADTVVVQHIVTEGRIMKVRQDRDSAQSALIDAVKADLKI